jgi:hypothetical protein
MNTTESIVGELQTELDGCHPVADFMRIKDLRQQINGHGALSRLRAEYETNPSPKLAEQVEFWRRQVWRDVDPPAPKPKRQRAAVVPDAPSGPDGEQA